MSQKGYEVIRFAVRKYPSLIKQVIIGKDSTIENDYSSQIEAECLAFGIPFVSRDASLGFNADFIIAVSWRWLITAPPGRLIVLHDSLLPKYRGFAPLVNALINGERRIGVTAIFGGSDYDKGDIISQKSTTIDYPIKIQEAINRLIVEYVSIVDEILGSIETGEALSRTPQLESQASYSIWRDDEDYRVDWTLPANVLRRMIDAVGPPYKGACTFDGNSRIIVDSAEEVDDLKCELRHVGKIMLVDQGMPVIICGVGLLKITAARTLDEQGAWASYIPVKKFRVRFK